MLTTKFSKAFKKDYKRLQKRKYNMTALDDVIHWLSCGYPLPESCHDHPLIGKDYVGCRECHITPDWLLVYEIRERELILYLSRTGMHSDIF